MAKQNRRAIIMFRHSVVGMLAAGRIVVKLCKFGLFVVVINFDL